MSGGTLTYEEFLARLEGVHRTGNQASAICPGPTRTTPEPFCFPRAEMGNSAELPRRMCKPGDREAPGRRWKTYLPQKRGESGGLGEIVARYNYLDESGRFLYQKTRWKRQDGKKSFTWSHKDSAGKWQKGRGGDGSVLYNLPALSQSPKAYLVEGEKDVETLKAHGLAAASPA